MNYYAAAINSGDGDGEVSVDRLPHATAYLNHSSQSNYRPDSLSFHIRFTVSVHQVMVVAWAITDYLQTCPAGWTKPQMGMAMDMDVNMDMGRIASHACSQFVIDRPPPFTVMILIVSAVLLLLPPLRRHLQTLRRLNPQERSHTNGLTMVIVPISISISISITAHYY